MKYKDYYAILGLERSAGAPDIKKAYRRLAQKFHPDVSKEAGAEEKFKEVAEAYQTLKDVEKRAAYDQLGPHRPGDEIQPPPDWRQQYSDAPFTAEDIDLSELFAHLHGGGGPRSGRGGRSGRPMHGQDFEVAVQISLEDAYRGTEIELNLDMPEYDADGLVHRVPHKFRARVPKGATDGQRLRVPGKGGKGVGGGRAGDLYLNIALRPHAQFRVSGHDVFIDLPLTPWEAVLGAQIEVPTPAGTVRLTVRAGTQAAQRLRLPGRGLPKPRGGEGDLYAVVQIVVPHILSDRERELFKQLADASTFNPRGSFPQEPPGGN